ncbi:MAG TPA: hypothetical protein VFP64_11915 [Pyrinomonadaceae bacterium]|nr:hypothetical protein [Pyrinomonadaceae bacterium]
MTENNFDVVNITALFLVPASILVGALGVAQTEGLKTGISALSLILMTLWEISALEAGAASSLRLQILLWMPALFLVCWIVSFVFHGSRFYKQKWGTKEPTATEAQTSKP